MVQTPKEDKKADTMISSNSSKATFQLARRKGHTLDRHMSLEPVGTLR